VVKIPPQYAAHCCFSPLRRQPSFACNFQHSAAWGKKFVGRQPTLGSPFSTISRFFAVAEIQNWQKFAIIWCFPWCSNFGFGARPGVILAAAQQHEVARFAAKMPRSGGKASVCITVVSLDGVKR